VSVPEPLDIERPGHLVAYLQATGRIDRDERPEVTVLAGGVSNRTVLVERPNDAAWVVKQALPKLRVAVDWYSPPERIHREALGLRWLAELAPPGTVVPFVFEDDAHHLLAMGAVPRPHHNWKSLLLAGRLDPNHVAQFADLLGAIHRRAWERRAEVEPVFHDRAFFESLRLEPYYAYTADRVPAARPFLHDLLAAIRAHPLTLVHGDFSPKNVLVHDGRLVLLDHEVIHWGDPSFDLGFALTHLLSKAHHLPATQAGFVWAVKEFWKGYVATVGHVPWVRSLEPRAVGATLGCLLARVDGRSPLEYLLPAEQERQRAAVLALMADPPSTVADLADRFVAEITSRADH
jgi:5-methylthioribose kinase